MVDKFRNMVSITSIERKDAGGVMSKKLQRHLTNAKNCDKTRVRRENVNRDRLV